ncbi:MAG: FtsW/RodA/SpoVE family cell cycle protein [Eubacteriales bacterium]|nr:FtsW/RodA/SpoVE family cell cycle protein [Eubacteriales bacterium]MDD3866234.1 FtsW/RodA/SpoVE family cell cycle protein [Eubacteriales bacterium]MDD4460750.1 FtsW/RodA/SpoVE family cell cycle protein [Eubacteriales bacterium]
MARRGIEHLKQASYFRAMDYWLLIPVLCMTLIGLYVLNPVYIERFSESYPSIFYRQAGAALIGLLVALVISALEAPTLRLIGWVVYFASIGLLALVLVDGYTMEEQWGADRWLNLPVIGSFQPSELAKIGLAMVSAQFFERISRHESTDWKGIAGLAVLYGVPILLISRQPDFGTSVVILFIFISMLFVFGLRWRYILLGLSTAVIMVPLAYFFYFEEYQKNRILTFLYPGHDPDASYNLIQSRLAIANGGLAGSRLETPIHVPVKESDFIYSAVSEHMGFVGTTALLIFIFFFLARIFYVASKVHPVQPASALTMVGIGAAMAFHMIENIGMSLGLLPVTGVPLPFVSHGGTAMLTNFIGLGVLLCISMDRNVSKESTG